MQNNTYCLKSIDKASKAKKTVRKQRSRLDICRRYLHAYSNNDIELHSILTAVCDFECSSTMRTVQIQ